MNTANQIYARGLAFLDQQIAALDTPEGEIEARLLLLSDAMPREWLGVMLDSYRAVLEEHMQRST